MASKIAYIISKTETLVVLLHYPQLNIQLNFQHSQNSKKQ